MKAITILFFIEAALAARFTQHRRAAAAHKSHPKLASSSQVLNSTTSPISQVEYSQNWAGAVIVSSDITSVTGTFTVPSNGASSSGSGESCASAWVGIDGDTCQTAILQTGIDFCYEGNQASFDAWYEWYPDYAYDFNLGVSAGDEIKLTVTATGTTAGNAVIENVTTGKSVTKTFTSGQVQGDLCRTNAEWIVEDFQLGGSLVAFADFGTVTFSSATATANGGTLNPGTASILDIQQNGEVLTSCSASSNEVTCTHT